MSQPFDRDTREHRKFLEEGAIAVGDAVLTMRIAYDGDGNAEYIGRAVPGALAGVAVWQIKKITYTTGNPTLIEWADGDGLFDNVWDDRAALTYA